MVFMFRYITYTCIYVTWPNAIALDSTVVDYTSDSDSVTFTPASTLSTDNGHNNFGGYR